MIVVLLTLFLLNHNSATAQPLWAQDGAYLVRAAGCFDCHNSGQGFLAGGYKLETPFGVFVTPNLTPDKETGLGNWTYEQFDRALRQGLSPNGHIYYPAFPYTSYSRITDEDSFAIWKFLRSIPPIKQGKARVDLSFPFNQRWLLNFWRGLFFGRDPAAYKEATQIPGGSKVYSRGAYLVESILHCAECHTPRNAMGALIMGRWMGGSPQLIDGIAPPNITPARSALMEWTESDWLRFLQSGRLPSQKEVEGEMAKVVQNTSGLNEDDLRAVVEYLRSLPAVETE